jgi:signal peptidase II
MRLNLQFNTGIAFSQATGSTALVIVIELAVVIGLLVAARRSQSTFTSIVLGLIIGGASGNLTDRLIRHHSGAVIDFIDPRIWPVFNIADAAVSIGVVLAIVAGLFSGETHRQTSAEAGDRV